MKKLIISLVFIISLLVGSKAVLAGSLHPDPYYNSTRVHFINVGHGDAILLESNGRFGMIDAGQGSWHYRPINDLQPGHHLLGHQVNVMEYVRRIAGDENGDVHLEFIAISHIHSDHIGGVREILLDETFMVDHILMKYYSADHRDAVSEYEITRFYSGHPWDSVQQLIGMEQAAVSRNIPIITDQTVLDTPIELGEFTIQLLSTEMHIIDNQFDLRGNQDSMAALITAYDRNVLLTFDISGVPQNQIASDIIESGMVIDLIQAPHHGFSDAESFIEKLNPPIVIITNYWNRVHNITKDAINHSNTIAYTVGDNNGIVLDFALSDFGMSNFQNHYEVGSNWVRRPEYGDSYWFYQNPDTLSFSTGWAFENSFNTIDPNKPGLVPTVNTFFLRRWENDMGTGPQGSMVTGWVDYNGHWFYFTPIKTTMSGTNIQIPYGGMVRGWLLYDNYLFYLNQRTTQQGLDGELLTGLQQIDSDWVPMAELNQLLTEWRNVDHQQNLSVENGRQISGWQKVDDNWYVIDSNGNALTGWQEVGQNRYFLNDIGRRLTGWQRIDGRWFYLNNNGLMQTGLVVIDGISHIFSADGHWQGPVR